MTLFRETEGGDFVAWQGEPIPTPLNRWSAPFEAEINGEIVRAQKEETYVDEAVHSLAIEQLWSDEELAALRLYRVHPAEEVPPHHHIVSSTVRRVGDVVRWVYELEEITVEARKAELLTALANRRWEAETGGLTFGAMRIPTDRDTQSRIDQIVKAYADGDLTDPVSFKMPFGFISLGETELRAIKRAGALHIQACFQREADIAALILAAQSHADLDAADFAHGWPQEE